MKQFNFQETFPTKERTLYHDYRDNTCINPVGAVATYFIYTDPSGAVYNMHHTAAEYLLLWFYNPDCQASKDIQKTIESSETLTELQTLNRLKIMAIYTGTDMISWWNYVKTIPKIWINGHNCLIHLDKEYHLPTIPTLYLLDNEKKVELKDATVQQIEKKLKRLLSKS